MRIPRYHQETSIRSNSAMTPMIDVVFLLLIFFVCASIGQRIEFSAPADTSGGSVDSTTIEKPDQILDPVWIILQRNAEQTKTTVQLNREGERYEDFAQFKTSLDTIAEFGREEIPVILDIADDVPAGDMLIIYALCRQARFQEIRFATDAPKKGK